MTYKILYEQSQFWLLRGWPEEPIEPVVSELNPFYDEEFAGYCNAIEQCKANKIRIANSELLTLIRFNHGLYWPINNTDRVYPTASLIKEGDIFDFPEGLKVEIETTCSCNGNVCHCRSR